MAEYPIFRPLILGGQPVGAVLCDKRNTGAIDKVMKQFGFLNYKEFIKDYPGRLHGSSKILRKHFNWWDDGSGNEPNFNSKDFRFFDGWCDAMRAMKHEYEKSINDPGVIVYPTLEEASKVSWFQFFFMEDFWFCVDWDEDWLDSDDGKITIGQMMKQNKLS